MTSAVSGETARLAYGYVRMEEPDEVQVAVICKDLSTFCKLGGYRLASIFVDRGVTDTQFARSGWTDLLAAVRLAEAHAVVVPTLDHLSPHATVRNGLKNMVEQLGVQVLVAYGESGNDPAPEAGS